MTIMIDDGKVPLFAQQGCWLTCHNGQRDMPRQFTSDEVKANALLTAIKFDGKTLYAKTLSPAQTQQANSLATTLDKFNNNNLPC